MARTIRELDEPETGWSLVSRLVAGLILVLVVAGASVPFFPKLKEYRQRREDLRLAEATLAEKRRIFDDKTEELRLAERDAQYIELQARDRLDLYRENEVIFRFDEAR